MNALKILLLIFIISLGSAKSNAQTNFSIKFIKATIDGTSTLHDWQSEITKIDYKGIIQSGRTTSEKIIKDVEIKIPVEGIKSKEGKIMDHKTCEAFDSDKNPLIVYTFRATNLIIDDAQKVSFSASGNLSMAGTTKPFAIEAKGKVLANGDIQLIVMQKIKMSEFNMQPPTAVLGAITVGDEVTVSFEFTLTPSNT